MEDFGLAMTTNLMAARQDGGGGAHGLGEKEERDQRALASSIFSLAQQIPEAKPPKEFRCVVLRDEGGPVPGFRDEGANVN